MRTIALLSRQFPVPGVGRSRPNALAEWLLAGAVTRLVGLFAVAVFLIWLPGYLTWPMWVDHDVFAALAQSWDAGERPYRDRPTTNFPGPIYQAWAYGHVFGWGNVWSVYAADAALLVVVAGSCVAWSRLRLGWYLPGVAAAAALVSYHAMHDFTQAAQRDWQATAFVLLAVLAVAGRENVRLPWLVGSAALFALGSSFRPQTIFFLPAMAAALGGWRTMLKWAAAYAASLLLLFLPLFANGLFDDFVREMRSIRKHGIYRDVPNDRWADWWKQGLTGGFLGVLAATLALVRDRRWRWAWLALAGVSFWLTISPHPHEYCRQPFRVTLVVAAMAPLAAVLKSSWPPLARLAVAVALIGCVIVPKPKFCSLPRATKAWRELVGRPSDQYHPPGYTVESIHGLFVYPWAETRDVLAYLRENTSPDTPVANLLLGPTALNGPTGRRSPLHAESMAWVIVVGRHDHVAFADELRASPDAVVVWRPVEWDRVPQWGCIPAAIRTHYQPVATIRGIEVWRRKPGRE
jgi:hypothetical protein